MLLIRWYLALLLAVGVSSAPAGASVVGGTIDGFFGAADLVAVVRIAEREELNADGETCGVRYRGEVQEFLKVVGSSTGQKSIVFGRIDNLELGEEYLVFLRLQSDARSVWNEAVEAMTLDARERYRNIAAPIALVECQGLVPGFNLVNQGAWPMDSSRVSIQEFFLLSIPSTIPTEVFTPIDKALDRASLLTYLRGLR